MPRTATRSQKPGRGSQAQPSQTQRAQRRRAEEPEDEEEEEEEGHTMDVDDEDEERGGQNDIKRMAHALVRLALFNEHKRMPLRRDEISKKVLGSSTRAFARVHLAAQGILRDTFGMELVELRTRAELESESAAPGGKDDLDEVRKAVGTRKKAAAAGSKTYILRSTLDARLIQAASATHEEILEDEAEDAPSDDDDDEFGGSSAYGSIISWSSADQIAPLGILYVILALVLVSGRVMGDQDLRAMLKRLGLTAGGEIAFSAASTHRTLTLDAYLTNLIRQGYLDRQQVGADPKKGKGKRGRISQADDDSGQTYEWRWGPRAQSEVGEQAIGAFIADFMVTQERAEDAEDEEETSGAAKARAKKKEVDAKNRLEKMTQGIARAAGGQLAEIK